MKISGIYRITNTVNGGTYVGSSKDVERRWQVHKSPSVWKQYPNKTLYKEMKVFGIEAFTFEVLEVCDNLFEREQYWMDVLKPTYNSKKSYNKKNHGISAVYQITCNVTHDVYIGSSVNVERRWAAHKSPSRWNLYPNNKMYQDMQRYGIEAFTFKILAEFPQEHLKRKEQEAIETLHPTYNSHSAYISEGYEAYCKSYNESRKEEHKVYYETHKEKIKARLKAYNKVHKDEIRAKNKDYRKSNKEKIQARKKAYYETHKEYCRDYNKAYNESHSHRKCLFEGEELTFEALRTRFRRKGIPHPTLEAKKYLVEK